MRYELEQLFALADRYHDAEEKADDLTCMDSYDTALSIGFTEEQWKDAYNTVWVIRQENRQKHKEQPANGQR